MLQIRLSDKDRDRLGCPEWMDASTYSPTMREYIAIQQKLGFTPDEWRDALAGEKTEQPDGSVEHKPGPRHLEAVLGLVWVALRHSGVDADLDDLDFAWDTLFSRQKQELAGDLGKDPSTQPETSDD